MSSQASGTASNSQTIARNSFWYGLEMFLGIGAALLTSIIVANVIGKDRLGPYIYVGWLTNITAGIGGTGLANTTRKYMAEYLNRGEGGVARAIYYYALKLQTLIALAVTVIGVPLALVLGKPGYRLVSALLVLNMAPRIVSYIPSQANMAGERLRRNTGPSLLGGMLGVGLTLFSIWMGWGLIGIALSFAIGCAVEAFGKLYSVRRWLAPLPTAPISPELKKRMSSYSGQGLVLMILNIVVWDRSDIVILNWMNSDASQLTFFGIAFGFTDKLLMLPNAFAGSLGATMMAQFGRGKERVKEITISGARYGFLMALPLMVGMACISRQFITVVYHKEYQPMIQVLAVAALLAIPKALNLAPTLLLQTVEKQGLLIWIGCICGVVDVGLDFLLTPGYGALGATLANGAAQTLAAGILWAWVYRNGGVELRLKEFARIAISGALMAGFVLLVQRVVPLPGYAGLALSILTGALGWLAALRLTGAISPSDGERVRLIGRRLPASVRPILDRCVSLLSPQPVP